MCLALGVSGIFPMVYAASEFGVRQAHLQMGWGWFVLEAVFCMVGVGIYASKYPEAGWPGDTISGVARIKSSI
jgi:adiponectin receptor